MNNLIQSDIKTMSSEDLYYVVCESRGIAGESRPRYNDFTARLVDELEGEYYESFVVQNTNNTKTTHYRLNNDQCVLVGMRESKSVRKQVLKKLKELSTPIEQAPVALPGNYIEALKALVVSEEEKAVVVEQLAIAAPKVQFHDSIVNDSQTFSVRDAAKKIQQRPIKFGEWLKVFHYICLNGRAAQKYIDMGLFVNHTGLSESGHQYTQTRVTSKGCAYFNNKLFEVKL